LNTVQNNYKPDPARTPERYQHDSSAGVGTRCNLVQYKICPKKVKKTHTPSPVSMWS